MKNLDPALQRLLRSASRAPAQPAGAAPYGFATRVAAHWRAGLGRDPFASQMALFRRALLCACAVAAITVGWSFKTGAAVQNDEVAIASYDAAVDLP